MITSSANSRVKQVIQWQTKAKERKKAGVFLTEGFKMYEEAPLESILEVYVAESALASLEKMAVKLKKTGYEVVADSLFKKMADTQTPQGILCVVKQPEYRLEEILKQDRPLLMILENLQDPGNLGTIIRTGEGAGVTGVIMTAKTVDIFNPKVIRATMGSVFRVPFLYVEDMEDTLKKLKEKGIRTYAAHLAGREYYDSFSFTMLFIIFPSALPFVLGITNAMILPISFIDAAPVLAIASVTISSSSSRVSCLGRYARRISISRLISAIRSSLPLFSYSGRTSRRLLSSFAITSVTPASSSSVLLSFSYCKTALRTI